MLTIWGRRTSSNVQALMWCIGELGLPYQRYDIGHKYGGTDTDEFYHLNPNRTVPVLQDGNSEPLWETGAILRYLANKYANDTFWSNNDEYRRANIERWSEWSKLNIALAFTAPIFWRVVRTPIKSRDIEAINSSVNLFEKKLEIAEERFKKYQFLAGNEFTLADIQFGHVLYRYYNIDIERKELPRLYEYYSRLMKRPAFQEHVMISYDELRA
ncbi:glutathione S-transferase family protein [Providencia burhodogranariea]|uniref:Glutathione S-transferase domain-containing protein n=1 Tax=Providencia burhodogranariea DSM 19968 TaxID=1141662 RepID=K8WXC3_9GAMM|nr:glutathione S-transferase family protein [Providencia burhodogranariea]EKT62042.1 glutathione S-transferase domain-containing protein [Providencia burhodogranariea DSM 19968]